MNSSTHSTTLSQGFVSLARASSTCAGLMHEPFLAQLGYGFSSQLRPKKPAARVWLVLSEASRFWV